ncbi:DUF4173 domain-containing protein [Micromonospora orduensis]|uniref:DUF4173 domain-containing protein n=1 Tax=Micromonospora orduensis TaxID=1420891 RepID=A0A5C4QZ91_9ACTN|nr:DUF4173 domain-containing protein [Micromonospora orduensis]TNH31438.1 DUF4173 domain-containing protein [Micromonospora orduensis]
MTSPGSTPLPAGGPTGPQVTPTARPGPAAPPAAARPQPGPLAPALPRPPSLIERRWPGPPRAARPLVLAALTAAAVVGASTLTTVRPGLGWLVAALAAVAALATASVVRSGTPSPATAATARPDATGAPGTAATARPDAPEAPGPATARPDATGAPGRAAQIAWAVATVALVGVGTVRAAGWLFALCLLAAVVTGTLAVTGGRSPLGMLLAATLPPAATVRALPWAARGLRSRRAAGSGIEVGRVVTSLAISAGLLLLFGMLFSSADAVFADLVTGLLPDISPPGMIGWAFRLLLIGGGLLGAAYLLSRPPDLEGLRPEPGRPAHRLEWTIPLVLLDALFAAFVLVQLTVLFGGAGHVLRTAGLTYAEYARGGFWQLLAVTGLTLLVIAIAARRAPKATRADRVLVRVLLGTLTALSLVIVASALYRMQVYADAYGATRLRLVVATTELWLGLLFVLVGVAVVRLRAEWLPRLVIGTAVLALLGLALVNPDRLIAERNVDRYLDTGRLDVSYLSGLSADAVPALDRLPEPMRTCALREIAFELPRDGFWATNLGRERARPVLDPVRATGGTTSCGLTRW